MGNQDRLAKGGQLITISGLILPVEWDQGGTVQRVAVFTHDEDEYHIDENSKGKEILGLIHQEVRVSGEMRREQGKKVVKVIEYALKT